ncbi:hepatic lectin-like [Neocloeon triangulifer]|uniref:hepatic lectin-like n=1 Tax=Neocloeon triangulifer TaxID=2078957 RepID=UPI00286EBE90|nr:hepatic lectin-like [Neocloeon triangulifer]
MLRVLMLFILASVLAENSAKTRELEMLEELTKNWNEMNEKLNRLSQIVYDQMRNFNESNQRLNDLAAVAEKRQNQNFEELSQKLGNLATQQQHEHDAIKLSIKCLGKSANLKTLSNGKKYSFLHVTAVNWTLANETCTNLGLNLATIRDQNEAEVVAEEAQRTNYHNGWWVLARNSGEDFHWQDGTKLELDSPLWKDGADKSQDCVRIYNWNGGKLDSLSCAELRFFICELPSDCY